MALFESLTRAEATKLLARNQLSKSGIKILLLLLNTLPLHLPTTTPPVPQPPLSTIKRSKMLSISHFLSCQNSPLHFTSSRMDIYLSWKTSFAWHGTNLNRFHLELKSYQPNIWRIFNLILSSQAIIDGVIFGSVIFNFFFLFLYTFSFNFV